MQCREKCAACCIVPSITSFIPGMPTGKPANIPCVQLTSDFKCKIFNLSERPSVCAEYSPNIEYCGENRDEAMTILRLLENQTK